MMTTAPVKQEAESPLFDKKTETESKRGTEKSDMVLEEVTEPDPETQLDPDTEREQRGGEEEKVTEVTEKQEKEEQEKEKPEDEKSRWVCHEN